MLSGKAVERAIRGHFLVDAALNAMLMSKAFHIDLPVTNHVSDSTEHVAYFESESQDSNILVQPIFCETEADVHRPLLEQLAKIYNDLIAGNVEVTDVQTSPIIQSFCDILSALKNLLQTSRNSKLWFQYRHDGYRKKVPKSRKNGQLETTSASLA